MTTAEKHFHEIADSLADATKGKMFGALCIKAPNGKAAVMCWKGFMVFKLEGKSFDEAMELDGAKLFDPMDGRPMKEWVQLSEAHASHWKALAEKAMEKVRLL